MRNIFDHIEHIKTKPHHVRKRVAFSLAGTGAGLIAFVWLGSSLSTGAFALRSPAFTGTVTGSVITVNQDGTRSIAGAAAALSEISSKPHIEIVNIATSTAVIHKSEATTIPF